MLGHIGKTLKLFNYFFTEGKIGINKKKEYFEVYRVFGMFRPDYLSDTFSSIRCFLAIFLTVVFILAYSLFPDFGTRYDKIFPVSHAQSSGSYSVYSNANHRVIQYY